MALDVKEFIGLLNAAGIREPNEEQRECIGIKPDQPVLIVAGPGSGKTTVLILRALRHLIVDQIPPESIVITTFTKKAAAEIRTRWLDWGIPLLAAARRHPVVKADSRLLAWYELVDLNRCITGTLDSICEQMLSDFRDPEEISPVLIEGFAANQILLRSGLREEWEATKDHMGAYLALFDPDGDPPRTLGDLLEATRPILERFTFDRVDLADYQANRAAIKARQALVRSFEKYRARLAEVGQMDFAGLELRFFERLVQGGLKEGIAPWKALLVDEYQDTNPLQEAIYFELFRQLKPSFTVVGDDDQSLYRFRGATVELFRDFVKRFGSATKAAATMKYLVKNYRSSKEIVSFYNDFVDCDPAFRGARIAPPKPRIDAVRPGCGISVLGMFRPSKEDLAADLATFLQNVFRGNGVPIPGRDQPIVLRRSAEHGDFGDAVYLASTVQEYSRAMFGNPPTERFPLHLRRRLEAAGHLIFNPRGRALRDQPSVQTFLGLLLECLDSSSRQQPDGTLTPDVLGLTNEARGFLRQWRDRARAVIAADPPPGGLAQFVADWNAQRSRTGARWPEDWPVLELLYKLMAWAPQFQMDPEHQVWLEAISRTASQAALFSAYGTRLLREEPHRERSRSAVIRDVLRPIAEGLVDVDEEILPSVPRDRLNLMTIHQAKGLEFPLVIVDVGSDFRQNSPAQRFKRFPERPSSVTVLEDDLANHSEIGPTRLHRSALDRSFDDLVRLHYVAYSRAQTILLLIGLDPTLRYNTSIRHAGLFWCRDGSWKWTLPYKGKKPPPVANGHPLTLI